MKKLSILALGLLSFIWIQPAFSEELANVNGTSITTEDYKKVLEQIPLQMRSQLSNADKKKELLNDIIAREILLQEAKRAGIEKDPLFLEEVEQAKKQILSTLMAQRITREKVSEQEIRSYYSKNIKDFQLVHASHILVKTEEEAQKIKKELSAGGDFSELAKKYSTDPGSGQKGGDLGFFNRKQMVQPFSDLAFKLKPNEMGGPVKTQFGYHLIKVLEVKNPKFEDLTQENKRGIQTAIFYSEIEKIKNKGKVTVNEEALKKVE